MTRHFRPRRCQHGDRLVISIHHLHCCQQHCKRLICPKALITISTDSGDWSVSLPSGRYLEVVQVISGKGFVRQKKMSEISRSQEYLSFRSSIPQRKIIVDDDNSKEWTVYEAGPKSVKSPLICFPPASGTADVYFRQILGLSALGYRVIAVEYPIYWTMKEFVEGFRKLLDFLVLDRVHIFGASLGGFLAQKFAEFTARSPRVASLILCNSFYDTTIFQQTNSAPTFWMMPSVVLKKMVMGSFEKRATDPDIVDSIDFMVERLDSMSQQALASRLTLNCMNCYVEPQKLKDVDVTLMDVYDECALSCTVRDEMCKCYPDAKRAHLKNGGNFPYLSRSTEVNVFLQIHLRKYDLGLLRARELTENEKFLLIQANGGQEPL